ncbi:MAG: LLM class F420-dependent oxidoreductase, partial [Chloroflexi bacterium]|nr:LLM class F420-dependent oxidoreductase [Chloroflexota bacterium]
MKLSFSLPVAGTWATPENQVLIAKEAEAHGYHGIWTLQRLLY